MTCYNNPLGVKSGLTVPILRVCHFKQRHVLSGMPNVIFLLPGFECQISMTNKKWKWLSLMLWPTLKPIAEGLILIKGTSKDQYSPGTYKHSLPSFYIHIWLTLNSHLSQLCMCDWCDVKLDMLRAFLLEFFGISKEIQSFLSLTLIKTK